MGAGFSRLFGCFVARGFIPGRSLRLKIPALRPRPHPALGLHPYLMPSPLAAGLERGDAEHVLVPQLLQEGSEGGRDLLGAGEVEDAAAALRDRGAQLLELPGVLGPVTPGGAHGDPAVEALAETQPVERHLTAGEGR